MNNNEQATNKLTTLNEDKYMRKAATALLQKIFRAICTKDYRRSEVDLDQWFNKGISGAALYLDFFFEGKVNIKGKTILDVGCGTGDTCIYMALNGAKKVVGIDIRQDVIDFASSKLADEYQTLSNAEFKMADELRDEKFDIVLSKNSFEHFSNPEEFIFTMKQYLEKDGIMMISFGPLWKSPYGGHIGYMTAVPWAHLIFPESVIMRERKRFKADGADTFEQVTGGLNKMTLARYCNIIRASGLKFEYFKTNVSRRKLMRLISVFRLIPFCKELFTINIYTIIRIRN